MVGSVAENHYLCRMNCVRIGLSLLAAFVITFAQAKNDVVPTIHRDIHRQLQELQLESQAFQSMVDSITSVENVQEEAFELFPALDLYANWEEGALWDNKGNIPATMDIDVSTFEAPTRGQITSPFGWRRRRMHKGTDLKVYVGDTIRSAFDGKIRIKKYERRGYGYYYVIRHNNGLETVYGHLSRQLVHEGDVVKAGQAIGLGGNTGRSTGSHLHFEMRFMGIALDPADIIDFDTFKPKNAVYAFNRSQSEWAQNNKGKRGARYRGESKGRESKVALAKNDTKSSSKSNANNASGNGVHRVKQGDTLSAIARRYGTTVSKLCKLNGIRADKTLQLGQKIKYK